MTNPPQPNISADVGADTSSHSKPLMVAKKGKKKKKKRLVNPVASGDGVKELQQ